MENNEDNTVRRSFCPVSGKCGGCQLENMTYERQLAFKQAQVVKLLGKYCRIDEIVPEGKYDIHADGGDHCYVGLRQSLCHGWGAGPTTWLSMRVLGIEPAAPGFRKVRIRPHLGRLEWAEGSFPTPYGVIKVSHRKKADGTVSSQIKLPKGIKLVKS